MSLYIKKILVSLNILSLIIIYVIKRRFIEFKTLISNEVIFFYSSRFTPNELVKYSIFWLNIFKISSCFTRSLVIRDMLIMGGFRPKIEIGVSLKDKGFESHCWVKLDDFYTEEKMIRDKFKIINNGK